MFGAIFFVVFAVFVVDPYPTMVEGPEQSLCIIGAGAVGLGLAAHLSRVVPVAVIARSNKLQQLRNSPAATSVTYVGSAGELPWQLSSLWICTKAYTAVEAIKTYEQLLAPTCPVVLVPNGLGVYMECAEAIGRRAPVVRALVHTGFRETLDSVVQAGPLRISLAAPPTSTAALHEIQYLLERAGAEVSLEKDIATAEWKKTLLNVATNPICGLLRAPNRIVAENAALHELAQDLITEARAVARAEGFPLDDLSDDAIFSAIRAVGENRNSLLLDIEKGRRTEIDYILGRVVRIAESHSVSVPRCRALYALCKAAEGKRGSG